MKARAQELLDDGVPLVQFGVHIPANRVRIGLEGLTPEIAESLRREFGPDQIEVFRRSALPAHLAAAADED